MYPVGDSYLLFGALQQFQFYGLVTPSESKSEKDQRVHGKYQGRSSLSLGVNGTLRQQQDDRSAGF